MPAFAFELAKSVGPFEKQELRFYEKWGEDRLAVEETEKQNFN